MMRTLGVRALVFVALPAAGIVAIAQTTGSSNPPLVIRSLSGEELYRFYCATCHGPSGRGDGPVAVALKEAPPDLRLLAHRNGGAFPSQRVEALVANDGALRPPAHGSLDMPVWGPIFRGLDASDVMTTIRLTNIVQYLESIQAK
jgi:mono/diheme cytochrome c family protein